MTETSNVSQTSSNYPGIYEHTVHSRPRHRGRLSENLKYGGCSDVSFGEYWKNMEEHLGRDLKIEKFGPDERGLC